MPVLDNVAIRGSEGEHLHLGLPADTFTCIDAVIDVLEEVLLLPGARLDEGICHADDGIATAADGSCVARGGLAHLRRCLQRVQVPDQHSVLDQHIAFGRSALVIDALASHQPWE